VSGNQQLQCTIFIPTRTSGQWIGLFARAYHALGLHPVYLLDTRTSDDTADVLRKLSMKVIPVTPKADRVEAILGEIPSLCESPWALRFDDDEFPSVDLVSWLRSNLQDLNADAVALSRRPCCLGRDGIMRYSRAEMFYWDEKHPEILDPQVRLFRPTCVRYTDQIHTPGVISNREVVYAPGGAFFAHFDWIVHTAAERISKIRNYDKQVPGTLRYARFYLPECLTAERLRETEFAGTELGGIGKELVEVRTERLLNSLK